MKRWLIPGFVVLGSVALAGLAAQYGASLYYAAGHGAACADCHEMADAVTAVHGSPHHNATCMDCHEASLSTKLRHVRVHMTGSAPEEIRLREADVRAMVGKCQNCHQREFAGWHGGPHSVSYKEIFTDARHNSKRRMMDDCFRCHGMYFDGGIRDLVQPQDLHGPWRLTKPALADDPSIPCQACHWIHHEGPPQGGRVARASVAGPVVRSSLAFFDRREELHFESARLAIPVLFDGAAPLKVSPDPRQGICYQCHAPRSAEAGSAAAINGWGVQAGSGDDRTPMGVHEGLSCLACHNGHDESARASCANCHPKMSNCGQDVEKMDTTFANPSSPHNIHWVKCADCHTHGIPHPKEVKAAAAPHEDRKARGR